MSSSPSLFGTDGIRGVANVEPLTPESAVRLGMVAAAELGRLQEDRADWPVCVMGRDTRLSGTMLEAAVAAGLASAGVDVRLAGVIPTPAVAYLTTRLGAAFGVVISASHNPYEDNGIKFFGSDGYKLSADTELAIEKAFQSGAEVARAKAGKLGRSIRGKKRRIFTSSASWPLRGPMPRSSRESKSPSTARTGPRCGPVPTF